MRTRTSITSQYAFTLDTSIYSKEYIKVNIHTGTLSCALLWISVQILQRGLSITEYLWRLSNFPQRANVKREKFMSSKMKPSANRDWYFMDCVMFHALRSWHCVMHSEGRRHRHKLLWSPRTVTESCYFLLLKKISISWRFTAQVYRLGHLKWLY